MREYLLPSLIACVTMVAPLAAQSLSYVSGDVRDPSGLAVPEAMVSVVNEETGFRRVATTRNDGSFVVASLQPGPYKITVRKDGFRTVVRFGVKLDVAQPARVDFQLVIGSMQETMTVEANAPGVDRDDAAVATLIGRDRIERLPLNGRGLLSLLELAPGTVVTPATRGESGQFSANGQRPNMNSFQVDGVSANSGVSGGGLPAQVTGGSMPGMTAIGSLSGLISMDALNEFLVQTSTASPDFGRLPGAQVSLSSRSGTNEWHGSLSEYFRNDKLDANDWFANRLGQGAAAMRMNDFGGSLGGPVKRDRTFVFVTYEGMRLRQPASWRAAVPTASLRDRTLGWAGPVLQLFPRANGVQFSEDLAEWTGRSSRPARLDAGTARLDHVFGPRLSVFGRYNEAPSSSQFGSVQLNQLDLRSRSLTGGANVLLRPDMVMDLRANFSDASANSQWGPADKTQFPGCYLQAVATAFFPALDACDYLYRFSIAGVGQVVNGAESVQRQTQWHAASTLHIARGAHQVRVGVDWRRLSPRRRDTEGNLSVIAESLTDFAQNQNLWTATSSRLDRSSTLSEVSVFVQDTWRLGRTLTATLGARWELAPAPNTNSLTENPFSGVASEVISAVWPMRWDNIAPRLGLAWRPGEHSRTVVRAGAGLYYDSSLSIATDVVNGGPMSVTQYSSAVHAPFATLMLFGFEKGLRLPSVLQWNFSVERALSGADTVGLSYVGAAGRALIRREMGGPGTRDLMRLVLATNHGTSRYHGLQAQWRRRLAGGMQAQASYAWSHSIDNSSSDSLLHLAGAGLGSERDRGSSDFDVRHSMTAAFTYVTPRRRVMGWPADFLGGWSVDGIFRARTGFPVNVVGEEFTMGLNFANAFRPNVVAGAPVWVDDASAPGGRVLNRAAFAMPAKGTQGNLGRGAIVGFGMHQVDVAFRRDLRLTERQRLQLRAEGFNLLNHPNFGDPVRTMSSPLFGQASSMLNLMLGSGSPGSGLAPVFQTGGARSMQMVLRWVF
jgi:hypothetical protein